MFSLTWQKKKRKTHCSLLYMIVKTRVNNAVYLKLTLNIYYNKIKSSIITPQSN